MPHLTRKQFLDRTWSAADLNAVAEFWLRLYEAAARAHGFSASPSHTTEIRLHGFPRADGPKLRDELARRVAGGDFRNPAVELPDPDTLSLASDTTLGTQAPPAGLGLPLLAGPLFDGLMVEFRITAQGSQGTMIRAAVTFTLVLVGEVVGGVFVLKAAWRAGSNGWEDDVCWHAAWPEEAAFFAAFDEARGSGTVPPRLARRLFVNRGADRVGGAVVKLIRVPLGSPRLGGLVWRVLLFAAVLAGLGYLAYEAWEEGHPLAVLPLVMIGFGPVWAFWHFLRNEARLWFSGYAQFRRMYVRLYEEAHRLVPIPSAESAALEANPFVRKITADLRAAGFTVAGDLKVDPPLVGKGVFRVFYAPDGVTHLTVIFSLSTSTDPEQGFRTWPANVSFLAHTLYADGGYAASVNGRHSGYRRKRTGPDVSVRVFPDVTDPVEFVRLHAEAAAGFADETGRRAQRHGRFDEYVRRQEALQEEERRLCHDDPYSWGDHLRWYLQTPRRAYRG